ncbi:hypothetical protein DFA_00754 [Cavenderia fasciculata]|uniref:Uncharacterized protein n=1 Tax=Cavenderia fasciculata TaxID=261658 RepID=F4PTK7_CACFS|nr:uncharacterized protein DFA_00754 [Cavenderia fasciculata]EGG20889.1 hypothetical protein DFA_00754 [Cavenderia fasciculata]|eukprot:XP_004358739.1 hypothetical protein DFA_00754 [Cavenderia fasciculata]
MNEKREIRLHTKRLSTLGEVSVGQAERISIVLSCSLISTVSGNQLVEAKTCSLSSNTTNVNTNSLFKNMTVQISCGTNNCPYKGVGFDEVFQPGNLHSVPEISAEQNVTVFYDGNTICISFPKVSKVDCGAESKSVECVETCFNVTADTQDHYFITEQSSDCKGSTTVVGHHLLTYPTTNNSNRIMVPSCIILLFLFIFTSL